MTMDVKQAIANRSTLNLSSQTVVATVQAGSSGAPAQPLQLVRVVVNTVGATAGTFNDCATTGAVAAGNLVLTIPTTAAAGSVFLMDWPFFSGITFTPGTSQVVSISWNG